MIIHFNRKNWKTVLTLSFRTVLLILVILGLIAWKQPERQASARDAHAANNVEVFLPLAVNRFPETGPIMLGIYPDEGYWDPSLSEVLSNEFGNLGYWGGKKLSLAGVFHNLLGANEGVINLLFSSIWNQGLTPFANLYINASASSVANGSYDAQIATWAKLYKNYADQGGKAFLAPMQEMNVDTSAYFSTNPEYFKSAYHRIRDIFAEQGVPADSIYWVFAPNGWSRSYHPPFEDYYPGDEIVDVVGFSSYNFGYHPSNPFKKWETPEQIYGAYLDRMRNMAPGKPIIIAQTGTTAYFSNGKNTEVKNQWLHDAYLYLSTEPSVIGVIYYNSNVAFDWLFYKTGSVDYYNGYQIAVANDAYEYIPPEKINSQYFLNP